MLIVKLYTSAGEFVADVQIIRTNELPDVVVWGQRIFARRDGSYREAFTAYATSIAPPCGAV